MLKIAMHGAEGVPADLREPDKKYTQEDVEYTNVTPTPGSECGVYQHYGGNGTCRLVSGSINPQEWCVKYQPAS